MLTTREKEVMSLTKDGLTAKESARELGISTSTVEFHQANAVLKLEARNIKNAIYMFALINLDSANDSFCGPKPCQRNKKDRRKAA